MWPSPDRGRDSDQGTVEDADLTLKEAALLAACSVKTRRRAIHGATAPALLMHYVDGVSDAQIMVRRADLLHWQREWAGQVPTLDNAVTTGQERVDTLDTVHLAVSSGSAALIAGIVAPLVADLAEARRTIQQQAEELGALRERLRALDDAQVQQQQQAEQDARAEHVQAEAWAQILHADVVMQPPTQLHLVADTAPEPEPPPSAPSRPARPRPRSLIGRMVAWARTAR